MKKTKIYFGEERLKDIYVGATGWEVFKYKVRKYIIKTLKYSFYASLVYAGFVSGLYLAPQHSYANEKIVTVESKSPVMDRIAKCESGGINTKNGQVIIKANSNGTTDVGIYQINSIWNKKASELGYNLTKEEDNRAFASWLYKNYGTEPWVYSKSCWNK